MTDDPPSIPTEPIDHEPLDYWPPAEKEAVLRGVLAAAGVELGAYDERIIGWFAESADWGTFAVIASWVQRAGSATTRETR